jgi:hypothetical protein
MATGIVSNALFLEGYREQSGLLFGLNALAYPWLRDPNHITRVSISGRGMVGPDGSAFRVFFLLSYCREWCFWRRAPFPRRPGGSLGLMAALAPKMGRAPLFQLWSICLSKYRAFGQCHRWRVAPSNRRHRIFGDPRHAYRSLDWRFQLLIHMLWGVGIGLYAINVALLLNLSWAPRKIGASLHRANQIQSSHTLSARGWDGTAWLLRFEPSL